MPIIISVTAANADLWPNPWLFIGEGTVEPKPEDPDVPQQSIPGFYAPKKKQSRLRWFLADSGSMADIAELRNARNKTLSEELNQPGSASFRIPINDEAAQAMDVVRTCVKVTRDNAVVWSGPIWTIADETDENSGWTTVGCKGWFEILMHRLVNPDQTPLTITGVSGGMIHSLLDLANAKGPKFAGASSSTTLVKGKTGYNSVQLVRTFEKFSNIGQNIQQLTELENGVDIYVNPSTRALDVYPILGTFRENALLKMRGVRPNLARVARTIDASVMGNRQWVIGANSETGFADNTASISTYSLFETQTSLSDVSNLEILSQYANGEAQVKGRPGVIYDLTPGSVVADEVPIIYKDIFLGDTCQFTVDRGRLQQNQQTVRLFGFTISDDDVERITSLKLQAS